MIEKHFTDDTTRTGPDHPFSMTPLTWRDMVDRTRELEAALGEAAKRVADNEKETVVIQRRCIRAASNLVAGATLTREMLEVLRPAPAGSIAPYDIGSVVGRQLRRDVKAGQHLEWTDLGKGEASHG
jgi:N-acetylneuraminate synthase